MKMLDFFLHGWNANIEQEFIFSTYVRCLLDLINFIF